MSVDIMIRTKIVADPRPTRPRIDRALRPDPRAAALGHTRRDTIPIEPETRRIPSVFTT